MRNLKIIAGFLLAAAALSASEPQPQPDPFGRELLYGRAESTKQAAAAPTSGEGDAVVGTGDTDPDETSTAEETESATATDKNDKSTGKDTTDKPEETGSASGKDDKSSTGKDDDKSSGSKKSSSSKKKSTKIPSTAQVGSISMLEPAATDGFSLFKIGDTITFKWNYTGVVVTPQNINIEAYATSGGANYFTVSANASGDTTSIEWDTGEFYSTNDVKLPVATYTLYIYDSKGTRTDVAKAGYLGPYYGLTFGMYTKQPYVSKEDFQCTGCSVGDELRVVKGLVALGVISALSFTWFVAGVL